MEKAEMIDLLNDDLRNEYKHMLFYLHCANTAISTERALFAEKFAQHARDEMEHVQQFAHKIRGMGGTPVSGLQSHRFNELITGHMLAYALEMEEEVVANYVLRRSQAEAMGDIGLALFIDGQIEDSQHDIDELRQLIEAVQ